MNPNCRRSTMSLIFRLSPAIVLAALFVLAGTPSAYAQVDRAGLEGTVTDPSGSVIIGAEVKVVARNTGLSENQLTNSKGYYRFPGLPVGSYAATVTNAGFKS